MKFNLKSVKWKLLPLILILFSSAASALELKTKPSLLSEQEVIAPGQTFTVALRFQIADHWHTYWRNAGDAGLATQIIWNLPEGFKAGEIQWPTPSRLSVAKDILNFGYEGEVWHLIEITAPQNLKTGTTYSLAAQVDWLECKEICVPGRATLDLKIKAGSQAQANLSLASAFQQAKARLPKKNASWNATAHRSGSDLIFKIPSPNTEPWHFFPYQESIIVNAAEQKQTNKGSYQELRIPLDEGVKEFERLGGLLVQKTTAQDVVAVEIDVPVKILVETPVISKASAGKSFGATLFLGFLGGLILNLMPCVFPVLGIKILSLVQQTGQDRKQVAKHGWAFTVGVLASFWLLAGVLLALRAGGQELGWGFQLQSSGFVYVLLLVMFIFGLNMSGVFEVGTSLVGTGAQLNAQHSHTIAGSFLSGVLATVVATPCAAPFLAPALGAALALPALPSLGLFTSIALGLAAPFLILSLRPEWNRFLPTPGAWMETFKQALAFLLYATAAYLLWVLEGQVEEYQLLSIFFSLVVLAAACWIYGRFTSFTYRESVRRGGKVASFLFIIFGFYLGFPLNPQAAAGTKQVLVWEAWSPELVEKYVLDGRVIYVDFTARWCATCQTNKKVVFSSKELVAEFQKKNVALLKADWTNQDPRITQELAKFGRSAVPFNLLYVPKRDHPIILPELLTSRLVLEALEQAEGAP
ncbi:MAG: protein-disulfide reductase DsbD family protein [Blastochloris sp.]|nr:protein-disulfide reductase DsbD family protein [Blastochloris sp.]